MSPIRFDTPEMRTVGPARDDGRIGVVATPLPCPEERRPAEILKVQAREVQVDEPLEELGLGQIQGHGRQAETLGELGLGAELKPDPGRFARPASSVSPIFEGPPCREISVPMRRCMPPCRNVG